MQEPKSLPQRLAAIGGLVFFCIVALEVVIMISPFAFFFYSVFSPVFNFLGQHTATRWATAFFLPHMILPPTLPLKALRVAGSVLFLVGCLTFTVCALQVYLGKIFHWGVASRGLYRYIRHPQYLSLAIWGIGMAILWPRFIVLATFSLMLVLYYFLAKDEERRMLSQYGAAYQQYLQNTGRFFPRGVETPLRSIVNRVLPASAWRSVVIPAVVVCLVMGTGVLLRETTLRSLPLAAKDNLTLVPILPEDSRLNGEIIQSILTDAQAGAVPFMKADRDYLGYVMPPDYIMQGMIADTGSHFHLFKQHHTLALITDWVFHPFAHLRRPPAAHMAAMHQIDPKLARRHHCPVGLNQPEMDCDTCPVRRVILVEAGAGQDRHLSGRELLATGTRRIPVGFIDLDASHGKLIQVNQVGPKTAWKEVPTPEI